MMTTIPDNDEQLREAVRERYAKAALQSQGAAQSGSTGCCTPDTSSSNSCCGSGSESSCCSTNTSDPIIGYLYNATELEGLPAAAALASLGCGNPTALAELKVGEKVLDLGSGGGIDVLLSAKRVGPTGFAYGLDMTDEMLNLAERNRLEAKVENVRFLKGIIEDIPLQENAVDVVISNCVINLSADKGQVLREAYRVLVPGGRFAVSDIVFQGSMPQTIQKDMEAWAGCISGALEEETYRRLLQEAGFTDVEVEVTRRYALDDVVEGGEDSSLQGLSEKERSEIDGKFVSAFIRGRKPL